jgi:hypothetical protein
LDGGRFGIAEAVDACHQACIQVELVKVHRVSFSSEVWRVLGGLSEAQNVQQQATAEMMRLSGKRITEVGGDVKW